MIQNLYNLSGMATVAEVIGSHAFFEFCGIEFGDGFKIWERPEFCVNGQM